MATPKKKVTGKKSASLGESRAASIAKDARDKASGEETRIYQKPKKPAKDSETYEYGDKKTRNTKFYSSDYDQTQGQKAKTLLGLKKAKPKVFLIKKP